MDVKDVLSLAVCYAGSGSFKVGCIASIALVTCFVSVAVV